MRIFIQPPHAGGSVDQSVRTANELLHRSNIFSARPGGAINDRGVVLGRSNRNSACPRSAQKGGHARQHGVGEGIMTCHGGAVRDDLAVCQISFETPPLVNLMCWGSAKGRSPFTTPRESRRCSLSPGHFELGFEQTGLELL